MANNFTFFGEVVTGGGTRTGRSGKIITFSAARPVARMNVAGGGGSVNQRAPAFVWGASVAKTLEEITMNDMKKSWDLNPFIILAVPHDPRLGNSLKFQQNEVIPRFNISIMEGGKEIGGLNIFRMRVESIQPVIQRDGMINGVVQPFSKLSTDEVGCTFSSLKAW